MNGESQRCVATVPGLLPVVTITLAELAHFAEHGTVPERRDPTGWGEQP